MSQQSELQLFAVTTYAGVVVSHSSGQLVEGHVSLALVLAPHCRQSLRVGDLEDAVLSATPVDDVTIARIVQTLEKKLPQRQNCEQNKLKIYDD